MNDPTLNIRIAGDLTAIRGALTQLSKEVGTLGGKMAKSVEVGNRSLAKLQKNLSGIQGEVRQLATSFAVFQTFRGVIGLADQFAQLNGVLGLTAESSEELAAAQKGVFDIAQRTRADVAETAKTYATLDRTTKNLNLTQTEQLRVLETVNKSIGLTPVSAQAAQAALVQFGQALGGDFKAGAQELNSILEQTPGLAISIAKGLGVQTSELKKMGEEGKLSAELVVRGLLRISESVDEQFAKVPRTIGGALTQIKNQLLVSLGTTDLTPLLESLDEFRQIITDPAVITGLQGIATGIVKISSAAVSGVAAVGNFAKFIGEAFAAAINGISAEDEVRLSEKVIRLREKLEELESRHSLARSLLAPQIEKLKEELRQAETVYNAARETAEALSRAEFERTQTASKAAAAEAEAQRKKAEADFLAAQAAQAKKAADEEASKAEEKRQKQIADTIADLKEEADTYGLTEVQVTRYKLALLGATQAQIDAGVAAAQRLAQLKEEEALQERLNELAEARLDAQQQLAEKLADARAQIAAADGDGLAGARLQLERQRDELLRLINEVDPSDESSKALVNRLFDVELARANAQQIADEAQRLTDKLRTTEDNFALQDQAGNSGAIEREKQIQTLRGRTIEQLEELRQKLLALMQTEQDQASRNATGEVLKELENEILRVKASAASVKNAVKDNATNALTGFLNNIATGAMKAKDAFRSFVLDFLQGLARMAAEAISKRVILSIFSAMGGTTSVGVNHGGGMAGAGTKRVIPTGVARAMFALAPRFHNGGIAGLQPNEVPAILKKGERVLTSQEQASIARQGGGWMGTRVINVFDKNFVPDQLNGPEGEKVILNSIGKNPGQVRQLLGL